MKKPKVAIIIITSLAVAINIALVTSGEGSMSLLIQEVSGSWPVVPFAVGVLCGHWFWPVGGIK